MGLLDLKSDLSKAFRKFPKEGNLEKMVQDPHASQLDYSAEPKKYQIPNDGRGAQVKYNTATSNYEAKSIHNDVSNKSQISGRFSKESAIETKKSIATGRHEDSVIQVNKMAPTPAKTAVEPIAMSATPVKQGFTPSKIPLTVERVGIDPTKIPLSGYVDNQPPKVDTTLYSLDVAEGALAEMSDESSRFNLDGIPGIYNEPGQYVSQFLNGSIISNLTRAKEPSSYAALGYTIDRITRYITPQRAEIDLDQEIGTEKFEQAAITGYVNPNPTIQIHGSNIPTSYDLDLDSVLESDSIYTESDVKSAYTDTNGLRFFSDHAKANYDTMMSNHIPSNGAITLDDQLNDIHSGFTGANTIPVEYNLNWFGNSDGTVASYYTGETLSVYNSTGESPSKLNINGQWIGNDPQGLEGLNGGLLHYITLSEQIDDELGQTLNMFNQNSGAHMVTGTSSLFGISIRGFRTSQNPNGGQNPQTTPAIPGYLKNSGERALTDFRFLDLDVLTTDEFFAKGRIGFDNNSAAIFRTFDDTQNFFNQDNPIMSNGFTPQFNGKQLVLTGPSWNWSLGNTELTEFEWIQNGDDNPSIFSINCTLSDPTINYFDVNNEHFDGYINYNNDGSFFAMTGHYGDWQHSNTVNSRYVGISGNTYINPGIYGTTSSTNYFDPEEKYAQQFQLGILDQGQSLGNSQYVNVGPADYDGITISNLTYNGPRAMGYSHGALFNTTRDYWRDLGYIFDGGNLFTHFHFGDVRNHEYGDNYLPSGLLTNPAGDSDLSSYVNETDGEYEHGFSSDWSYWNIINPDSTWNGLHSIQTFNANVGGSIPSAIYYHTQNTSKGPNSSNDGNVKYLNSWYRTIDPAEQQTSIISLAEVKLRDIDEVGAFIHPLLYGTGGKSTFGYGLGPQSFLRHYRDGILIGESNKLMQFRLPFGRKHVTVLRGLQRKPGNFKASPAETWDNYDFAPKLYGTKPGLSAGGIGGIATGGYGWGVDDMYLEPYDIKRQLFYSYGAGIDSMGGKTYEQRMNEIVVVEEGTGSSGVMGMLNSLNPLDNIREMGKQVEELFKNSTKRWWEQHNRFAVNMSANPPQGTHKGLPSHAASAGVGRFTNMIPGGLGGTLTTMTGLSARKYWSVCSYGHSQLGAELLDTGIIRFNDFRMFISDMGAAHVGLSGVSNYIENNIHKRYGYPESGKPGLDRKMYTKTIPKMGDPITMEDVYIGDKMPDDHTVDYIKFYMKDVANNEVFRFRAYISGLTDSITPNWSQYNYIGRPDPVFQYNGASARTISFNLKVAALARQDMYWMWKKINKMIGLCYPSEYNRGKFMTSPMMELTLGDYVHAEPCFINALTVAVPDASPWEINLEGHRGDWNDSLGNMMGAATNILNDPAGAAANFLLDQFGTKPVPEGALKYDKNYPADSKGTRIAQLPHMVDMSLGFTILGQTDKQTKAWHIGSPNQPQSKEFFRGWEKSVPAESEGNWLGGVGDFLGL